MKCEYCDSIIQNAPDNGRCPNCGGVLSTAISFPEPPFSSKKVPGGYLEFKNDGLRICIKPLLRPEVNVVILYNEVFDAIYTPATCWKEGVLYIRSNGEYKVLLPGKIDEPSPGDALLWFGSRDNDLYYQTYMFIKGCAQINAEMATTCFKQVVYPKPPIMTPKVSWGSFELRNHSVRMSLETPKIPRREVIIPYGDIYDISYIPATMWLKGFLCIRDVKKRNIPLPRKFGEHRISDDIVWFEARENDVFHQVYTFLKECAEINAKMAENE